MNAKQLIAASALALIGSAALAGEATQFVDPPSTLSRSAVIAELDQARASGQLMGHHEADLRSMPTAASVRSRAEVRTEARIAGRNHRFNPLYVGA